MSQREKVSLRSANMCLLEARGEPAGFVSLACFLFVLFFFFGPQKESEGGGGERAETERWRWGEREEGTRRTKLK